MAFASRAADKWRRQAASAAMALSIAMTLDSFVVCL